MVREGGKGGQTWRKKKGRVGAELEVDLLVCSVGFRPVRRKNALDEEESGTERGVHHLLGEERRKHTPQGVHARTHTRVTRMLGLHPSHESKLFEARRKRYGAESARKRGRKENVKGTG